MACFLFFFSLFPVLDILTHPVSVLFGDDYTPWLIWLGEVYWDTDILQIASISVPLMLLTITILMQRRRFGFILSLAIYLAPFLAAITIQYFIVVQLDKYFYYSNQQQTMYYKAVFHGRTLPWEYVFQMPVMMYFLDVVMYYTGFCCVLFLVGTLIRKFHAFWGQRFLRHSRSNRL